MDLKEKYDYESDERDYDDILNFLKNTTSNRLFLAVLICLLSVAVLESVAAGDLLVAPKGPKFPGNDVIKASDGFEWRGKPGSRPGSKEGNYYNPETGESLRPDLNHPDPIGSHWDYRDTDGKWWRIFPDGSMEAK